MDDYLLNYLKKHEINYKVHKHQSFFTVEETKKAEFSIPNVFHTKNLFLKDENKNYYLVCINADKKLNTKKLKEQFNVKKINFASAEELKSHLNLTPGSVSIFGMIYAKKVILILDKEILESEKVGFHPNINNATLELKISDLKKFLDSLKTNIVFMNL